MNPAQPGLIVTNGVVVLTGDWLRITRQAVLIASRQRGLNGLPVSAAYGQLAEALTSAMSATGQGNSAALPESPQWLSTKEAAKILKCSERHARRVATDIGHRIGGRWVIPANALEGEKDVV